jgi:hypothetical protein
VLSVVIFRKNVDHGGHGDTEAGNKKRLAITAVSRRNSVVRSHVLF